MWAKTTERNGNSVSRDEAPYTGVSEPQDGGTQKYAMLSEIMSNGIEDSRVVFRLHCAKNSSIIIIHQQKDISAAQTRDLQRKLMQLQKQMIVVLT